MYLLDDQHLMTTDAEICGLLGVFEGNKMKLRAYILEVLSAF